VISTIPLKHCRLGRVGIVETDYAQGQLHFSRAPYDSVRSIGYKTDGPWRLGVSQPKPFVYKIFIYESDTEIWLLFTRKERWIFNSNNYPLDFSVLTQNSSNT